MSYEGYQQHICANGHYFVIPENFLWTDNDDDSQQPSCMNCGQASVFCNYVDDTNCDEYGIIPPDALKTLLIKEEQTKTCPTCNHVELLEPARYRVPSREELERLQHYRDYETYTYKLIQECLKK